MSSPLRKQRRSVKVVVFWLVFAINCFYLPIPSHLVAATPIGQMVVSGTASPTRAEATVFNGDVVTTAPNQAAAITLKNAGLLNVAASSTVRLEQDAENYRVGLDRGEVSFSSPGLGHGGLKVRASSVEVSVPAASATKGRVVITPEHVLVSALSGGLQVASNGKNYSVSEGDSRVIPTSVTSNEGSTDQKSDEGAAKSKKKGGAVVPAGGSGFFGLGAAATVAIIAGIGVGTGIIIWQATKDEGSPSRP